MAETKRQAGRQPRLTGIKDIIPRFLLVCEGERTEPNYFKSFPVSTLPNVINVDVRGTGYNTVSLVEEAIRLRGEGGYEQVWCVFDRDSFPPGSFNDAIELAQKNNMSVAYSNEAFELWYLLHYNYCDTATSRASYGERLSELMEKKYTKNSRTLYHDLLALQASAIRNAEKLLSAYSPHNPAEDNPCTTVHRLVLELNKYVV